MFGDEDADGGVVFEGAELFEPFGFFEWGGGEGDEEFEEVVAVSVDSEVAVGGELGGGVATERDGGAGEVEGVVFFGEGEFDDVGVVDELGIVEGAGGGDHGEGGILAECLGEGIDEGGVEEGFVALDIHKV